MYLTGCLLLLYNNNALSDTCLCDNACAYLTRSSWRCLLGIDWIMKSMVIRMDNEGIECADETIVKHGAATGEFVSWKINK
jgi:hypothetical protein